MSKKHSDEILAALETLQTDEEQSHALCYLVGVLSAKAEDGRPVSATRLAEAVVAAVESARGAAERARARAWRPATEAELPEPRKVPDIDPTRSFSHAMAGIGDETSWCGASGRVAVLASSVTCPVCRTMLSRENGGDQGAWARTSASDDKREGAPLTLADYRSALAYWERKAEEASAAGDQAALAYRTEGTDAIRQTIQRLERCP